MESGLTPGALRFSFTTLYGSNFEGGHFSREGTSTAGADVSVPLYRHEVSLDYARVELALQYTLAAEWDLVARVPWEQKAQHASSTPIESASAEERAAMQRNIDVHHRSITLRGIGDVQLLGRRRWGDAFSLSFGASLPTGHTVENPYRLGAQGVQHLHIQFGTGTIDPLLEGGWRKALGETRSIGAYAAGRYPLYENERGFRGPPEVTLGAHFAQRATERVQLRLEGAAYAQGYGYWDGLRDENTGLTGTSVTAGATYRLRSFSLSGDVRWPLSQRTLSDGDAFTQGPTFVLSWSGGLSARRRG